MIGPEAAEWLRAELARARELVATLEKLEALGILGPSVKPAPGAPNGKPGAQKRCKQCGKIKPITEFYEHAHYRDGHKDTCKACERARQRRRWKQNVEGNRTQGAKAPATPAEKTCSKCGQTKPAAEFSRSGAGSQCKTCVAEYQKQWYTRRKKHVCETCGKAFASIDTLTEHQKLWHS
jgi:hypothetical protein